MDLLAAGKLRTRYFRKTVTQITLALLGYMALLLFLPWLCTQLGALGYALWEHISSGAEDWSGGYTAYRHGLAALDALSAFGGLTQLLFIPAAALLPVRLCLLPTGRTLSSLARGKPHGKSLRCGLAAAVWVYAICQCGEFIFDSLTAVFTGLPYAQTQTVQWDYGGPGMTFLLCCLVCPVCEELLFRGAVLWRLRPYGESFAIAASTVLFALMHSSLPQVYLALCMGIVLGRMTVRTGSLSSAIVLHMLFNLLDFLSRLVLSLHSEWSGGSIYFWLAVMILSGAVFLLLSIRSPALPSHAPCVPVRRPWASFLLHPLVLLLALWCVARLIFSL